MENLKAKPKSFLSPDLCINKYRASFIVQNDNRNDFEEYLKSISDYFVQEPGLKEESIMIRFYKKTEPVKNPMFDKQVGSIYIPEHKQFIVGEIKLFF